MEGELLITSLFLPFSLLAPSHSNPCHFHPALRPSSDPCPCHILSFPFLFPPSYLSSPLPKMSPPIENHPPFHPTTRQTRLHTEIKTAPGQHFSHRRQRNVSVFHFLSTHSHGDVGGKIIQYFWCWFSFPRIQISSESREGVSS